MNIYFIKVALRGISPMIWRRLRVPGSASLAMLHECIQIINGWDDAHLHQFHIYGTDYGLNYPGGLNYSDDARKVLLHDFQFDIGDKFTYQYNFTENHLHDIRIENIKNRLTKDSTISCLSGAGMFGATKYDVIEIEHEMLIKLVKQKGNLTWDDINDFQEKINRVKFNKKIINKTLAAPIEE